MFNGPIKAICIGIDCIISFICTLNLRQPNFKIIAKHFQNRCYGADVWRKLVPIEICLRYISQHFAHFRYEWLKIILRLLFVYTDQMKPIVH